MPDHSQFKESSPAAGEFVSTDEFQTPQFLRRLNDWMRWTRIFGWMLIAAGGLQIAFSILGRLSALSQLRSDEGWGPLAWGMILNTVVVFAAFMLPGIFIIQAGRHTDSYLRTDDPEALVDSFRALHHFWRTVGIMAALVGVLICVALSFVLTALARSTP